MAFPTPTPREIPSMASGLLMVITASVSCVAICIIILTLVLVLYRKDPLCCRMRLHRAEHYTDDSPQYHSRHSLITVSHHEQRSVMNRGAFGPELPGRLFIIGKPNDYHLGGPLPRLPSYESVRKKDRQRHIHSLIAQRFGLSGCSEEPPPSYEETLRQSRDFSPADLQSLDVQLSVHAQDPSTLSISHLPVHSDTSSY